MERLFRELECPVCMTVRQGRIYECPNAHIICQKCHDKLAGAPNRRRCPACKDEMPDPPIRNVAIERIVDREVQRSLLQNLNNRLRSKMITNEKTGDHSSNDQRSVK